LIKSETLAPQPKTEPELSKAVTADDEIQKICNDIKASLEMSSLLENDYKNKATELQTLPLNN